MKKSRQGSFLISKVHQFSDRILNRLLKNHGVREINPAQGRIMFALWRCGRIPISELARETSLGKSTLTSMLDRLESAGLIKRVRSKDDRRQIFIERTEKDKAFQDLYVGVSQGMSRILYNGFSANEIDSFESYLGRIYKNLERFKP